MLSDFHYGVVKVLARAAGFKEGDAQIIAYASQYVDDAVSHQLVVIEKLEKLQLDKRLRVWTKLLGMGEAPKRKLVKSRGRNRPKSLNPICTAHNGLENVLGLEPKVQHMVYVPFHFIPQKSHIDGKKFSYITRPGAELPRSLLNRVLAAYQKAGSHETLRPLALCAIGCALHSYADTWSHEGFSGRWSTRDNNATELTVDRKEPSDSVFEELVARAIPIGHLDVSCYVDQTYGDIKFKFKRGEVIERNNTDHYKQACQSILGALAPLNGFDPVERWNRIEPKLDDCLREPMDHQHRFARLRDAFKQQFPKIQLSYNQNKWELDALKMSPSSVGDENIIYKLSKSQHWFDFHVAAAAQRTYIVRRLPAI